jgi:hypothetical protein
MFAFRLPVSGLNVVFREPTGAEDILLAEELTLDTRLSLVLVDALGRLSDGEAAPWGTLPITDLDAALLAIRMSFLGDEVKSSVTCASAARVPPAPRDGRGSSEVATTRCQARIDISFGIGDYLSHNAPTTPSEVSPAEEPGWYRLNGAELTFRLASCADQITIDGRPDAERELARRCIRPEVVSGQLRRKAEVAMAKLAPSLFGNLDGVCPECGASIRIFFDPQRYVLGELREQAKFVFEEIHLIASQYHWSEKEILSLPRTRRARYAEFVSEARGGR